MNEGFETSGAWILSEKVRSACLEILEEAYPDSRQGFTAQQLLTLCEHTCEDKIWVSGKDAALIFSW